MTDEICHVCCGAMKEGFTEMKIRVDGGLLVITNIPADVCSRCDEALITPEVSDRIDKAIADYRAGKLSVKSLKADEIVLE